jgi:hypothetical protein
VFKLIEALNTVATLVTNFSYSDENEIYDTMYEVGTLMGDVVVALFAV